MSFFLTFDMQVFTYTTDFIILVLMTKSMPDTSNLSPCCMQLDIIHEYKWDMKSLRIEITDELQVLPVCI